MLVKSLTEKDPRKRPSASDLIFSNLIPFICNDNVLCAYFNKIIDKNKHKKLLELLIQKKLKEKPDNFHMLDYFGSINYFENLHKKKFDYIFSIHNRILRILTKIFERNNVEMLNLSNIDLMDNKTYTLCCSKYNHPLLIKSMIKRNVISKSMYQINHIFLNKDGQAFETANDIYKKLSKFIIENDLILFKSYVNEIFTEFNITEKRSIENNEIIVSYVWKMNNNNNIVFSSKDYEREIFEVKN